MIWIHDDSGDLINLQHIASIMLMPIDRASQDAPEGHTHELLAVDPVQESYRLFTGTEEQMKKTLGYISVQLQEKGALI